ncbi:thiolase family protein [Pseudonocardia sp. GCM10023141]|uniref:thiolase family protein n=1 Tax=Pseudonocardia sp. GCM10023141 TaxID=3252653 RepID=UPI0036231621
MEKQRYDAYITGVGHSEIGRALFRDPLDLATDGCLAAIADAGLTREDIDGIAAFSSGAGSVGAVEVQEALAIDLEWFDTSLIGPSQLLALFNAIMAVQTGIVRHAVVFHASCEGTARKRLGRGGAIPGSAEAMPSRATGMREDWLPYGAPSAGNLIAMYAQRHFHEYGTTREQLAQIPLVQRANATLNPQAVYRDPLSLADYLGARMITEPFCLYDCDVPVDFCSAVVVSRSDSLSGLTHPPIAVTAAGTAVRARSSWTQFDDLTTMMLRDAATALWERTDLRPSDVDIAELYDGFSFIALAWLEALGFCGKGEGGPFVEGGSRISLDGELPLNTNGGQLSAGRMHGWGYVPEACVQLWGSGGERQVQGGPEVAVVGAGGGIYAGALLLTRG